ncbi:uncharacterized protein EDB91DRAFT_56268 [Suillus paluster]|uniref:uncharacterized protein n=1 Tax=Suillus paluster TaxID=48578 RepID=UPI001B869A4E|nr:uncharacterized protein EDB91DRAFT_56268 [Suillus paluster]KAG1726692.1 hypothetical protein EDB91DRAFT_56268 [Suillus paluster]
MTALYLSVRYLGILYAVVSMLSSVPTISGTDVVSQIISVVLDWMSAVVNAILGVIMIARLHAMYQRSRNVLIVLVSVFLAVNITNAVLTTIVTVHTSGEELILSGTYQCTFQNSEENALLLGTMTWILITVWEVLALGLAVWIAIKRFRELRRSSRGWIIGDCFTALMKTHAVYFASFVAVSCLNLLYLSPSISGDSFSLATQIYLGFLQIFELVQMFMLGPRLILSVREFNAKLVADTNTGSAMTSIAFQERVQCVNWQWCVGLRCQ